MHIPASNIPPSARRLPFLPEPYRQYIVRLNGRDFPRFARIFGPMLMPILDWYVRRGARCEDESETGTA